MKSRSYTIIWIRKFWFKIWEVEKSKTINFYNSTRIESNVNLIDNGDNIKFAILGYNLRPSIR